MQTVINGQYLALIEDDEWAWQIDMLERWHDRQMPAERGTRARDWHDGFTFEMEDNE